MLAADLDASLVSGEGGEERKRRRDGGMYKRNEGRVKKEYMKLRGKEWRSWGGCKVGVNFGERKTRFGKNCASVKA